MAVYSPAPSSELRSSSLLVADSGKPWEQIKHVELGLCVKSYAREPAHYHHIPAKLSLSSLHNNPSFALISLHI